MRQNHSPTCWLEKCGLLPMPCLRRKLPLVGLERMSNIVTKEARSPPGMGEDVETMTYKLRRNERDLRFANTSSVTAKFQGTNRATLVVDFAYCVDRISDR
jgi:hypothetical protein